jgi:hypothetical protein
MSASIPIEGHIPTRKFRQFLVRLTIKLSEAGCLDWEKPGSDRTMSFSASLSPKAMNLPL